MTKHKLLSLLMALVMCFSLACVSAGAIPGMQIESAKYVDGTVAYKVTGLTKGRNYYIAVAKKDGTGMLVGYTIQPTGATKVDTISVDNDDKSTVEAVIGNETSGYYFIIKDLEVNVTAKQLLDHKKVTVSYNLNSHGTGSAPTGAEYKAKDTVTKPATDPTDAQWTFKGWATTATGSAETFPYTMQPEYVIANDTLTFYAVWEKKCVVTFDGNKPSTVGASKTVTGLPTTPQYVSKGEKVTAPSSGPSLAGWTFNEWQSNNSSYDFNTAVNADLTLKAAWTANNLTLNNPAKSGDFAERSVNGTKGTVTIMEPATGTGSYTYSMTPVSGFTFDAATRTITDNRNTTGSAGTLTVTITDTESTQTKTVSVNYGAVTASSGGGGSTGGGGGGGGAVAAANVTTSGASNGSIKVSNTAASAGDKVTVTLTPSKGYEADTLTVKDKSGATVTATKNADGTYTFTMPAASKLPVSVSATFKKVEEVKPVDDGTGFVDVASGEFYTDAVAWAAKNGITKGTDDTHFSPNASCTRAQVVTFLWRAAGSPAVASGAGFSDIESGSYYSQAVAWAVANGITNGTDADHFSPKATVNRAQVVTFLYRYEKATASGSNSFMDVPANSYYSDAVTWAVRNNITNGTGNNHFSPENDCTRGQIVTFLYRDFVK